MHGKRGLTLITAAALCLAVSGAAAAAPARPTPGLAPAPAAMSADPLEFGDVEVGTSTPLTLTWTNSGTEDTDITAAGIQITGDNAADFTRTGGTCVPDLTVTVSTSCTVVLAFAPAAPGSRNATLTIGLNPTPDATAALHGNGVVTNPVSLPGVIRTAGPKWNYNDGAAGRTATTATGGWLHVVSLSDVIGGKFIKDKGPYLGVYYTRSSTNGNTWSAATRLNPAKQHAMWASMAAAKTNVYAAWTSVAKVISWSASAPRVVWFRRNTSHGKGSAWKPTLRLSSKTGRATAPAVAAAGAYVYVAWTDSVSGKIMLATSKNNGLSFTTKSVGSTTRTAAKIGRSGWPSIAAAGSTVIVSWLANNSWTLVAKISTTNARTFGAQKSFGTADEGGAVSALGKRAAIAWTSGGTHMKVAVWRSGAWKPAAEIAATTSTADVYSYLYGPAVTLTGTRGVAVAFSGCDPSGDGCNVAFSDATKDDLLYAESRTNGAFFPEAAHIADSVAPSRVFNDYPAIVTGPAGARYVFFNGGTGYATYRIYVWKGTAVGIL